MGSDAFYGGPSPGVQSGPGVDTTAAHRAPASQESGGLNLAGAVAAALGFTTPGPTQGYGHTLPVVQAGQALLTFGAGTNFVTLVVTFPFAFALTPVVLVTAAGDVGQQFTVSAGSVGPTFFNLAGRLANNVGSTVSYAVWWGAIGTPN